MTCADDKWCSRGQPWLHSSTPHEVICDGNANIGVDGAWTEGSGCMRAQIEQKKRERAQRAAGKQHKPLFGEDGVQRGMLDKYDEEEEEAGMEIDASGAVNDEKAQKQADIRAKLAAGGRPLTS